MKLNDISLLPDGISDMLPEQAMAQHQLKNQLLQYFADNDYQLIIPPLLEFSDNLMALNNHDMPYNSNSFRTTDPNSQRTLAFRTDITPQVARVAMTYLKNQPRPLRLCYAGEVVRIKGSLVRSDRQFTQTGCELIGDNSPQAQVEILQLAVQSLQMIGLKDVYIDVALVNMPQLLAEWLQLDAEKTAWLKEIFANKMLDQINDITDNIDHRQLLYMLLKKTGPLAEMLPEMLEFLAKLTLPENFKNHFDRLQLLWDALQEYPMKTQFLVDFAQIDNFTYHDGWAYNFYAKSSPIPLGRGGAYHLPITNEQAVGFSFYMDALLLLKNT